MKICFFGLGSIGQRHMRLIAEMWPEFELCAVRTNEGQKPVAYDLPFSVAQELPDDTNVAFITNPTYLHIETALECAKRDCHLFIEKPIGHSTEGLGKLLTEVEKRELTAYVGYCLRFHPIIALLEAAASRSVCARFCCSSYLPDWRPGTDHLKSYSAQEKMGGGVLLDMSHHVYLVEQLWGSVDKLIGGRICVGDVTANTDDCAELVAIQAEDHMTSIHIDFFTRGEPTDVVYFRYRDGVTQKLNLALRSDQADNMYRTQLEHFFSHLGRFDIPGGLHECAPLFRKLINLREETRPWLRIS